jgi:hypothetical protein
VIRAALALIITAGWLVVAVFCCWLLSATGR